ncbi:DMT family transporter [Shewanella salipaludis]|uniref:EamA family transporter n=1 Tax=Shewanella salipaludis TaxID=2723052 RepID=A0A972FUV0_9GAMM|nr:DMT family transporter [Shewanella salipaludis]NMH66535.1 EamA family transporter [Shewanella salipaludis]
MPFILLALLSAIFMGTIGVLAKYAALPAEHITFYRLLLGACCLASYMAMTGKAHQIRHRPSKRTLLNGVMLAGFMAFYVEAIQYINMANAVMLIYLAPPLTAVIAHCFLGEKLAKASGLTIVLALAGFALMLPQSASDGGNANVTSGYLYALLALLSYSGFMLINRKPSQSTPYQSTLVQLSVGALCMLPLVIQHPLQPSLTQAGWLVAIGVLPGFIAILFAVKALRHLPAATFGTLAYVEPVAVVVFAWWLFAETLNEVQLFGCSLIILAGMLQGYLGHRQAAQKCPV